MLAVLATAIVALLVILAIVWTFLRALEQVRRDAAGERERHAAERTMLYADHRAEIRELLNRYQFPTIMPTTRHASVPAAPAPDDSIRDRQRRAWLGVGRTEPPLAVPDTNGHDSDDELGTEVP